MRLRRVTFTPTIDTGVYASGDVLFDTTEVVGALVRAGGRGMLRGITIHDAADQGAEITLVFLRSNVSLGTVNSAPSITDANAANISSIVQVQTADYTDVGGAKIAVKGRLL